MSSVDNLNRIEVDQPQEVIDFRMISFTLGGRDYGIDIMDVNEISKIDSITYVPNTASYVRGVYNLRGEIISLIDLRIMFHLPVVEKGEDEPEDVLFLRSGDRVVGVIVDQVNDVVGVSKERIQPPPPVFEEINIRYISGVVESSDILFIILDTDLVFGEDVQGFPSSALESNIPQAAGTAAPIESVSAEPNSSDSADDLDFTFVRESLQAFASFYASEINDGWMRSRFSEWTADRAGRGITAQLQNPDDAVAFLSPFYSASRTSFWSSELLQGVSSLLPESDSGNRSAWVVGAGDGYDPYSLACILREKYSDASISVWAHDTDLLKVSSAPTMLVKPEEVSAEISKYLTQTKKGSIFSNEIRNSVYFEYHDVSHENTFPPVQIIVARDCLSFLPDAARAKLIADFRRKLAEGGIVIVGENEKLSDSEWELLESGNVQCYSIK